MTTTDHHLDAADVDFQDLARQAVASAESHIECEVDLLRSRMQGEVFAAAIRADLPAGLPDLRWMGHDFNGRPLRFSASVRRSMSIYNTAELESAAGEFATWYHAFAQGQWSSKDIGDRVRSTMFIADMQLGNMSVPLRLYVPVDFIAPDHARRVVGAQVARQASKEQVAA